MAYLEAHSKDVREKRDTDGLRFCFLWDGGELEFHEFTL